MLLERLKHESRDAHQALEKVVGLAATRGEHRAQIQGFFGFIEPWEIAIRQSQDSGFLTGREKTPLLLEDLRNHDLVESEIAALPRCEELPALGTTAEVLGSFYVIEGSTLGGQFISRHLERSLGLSGGRGYRYFAGHGSETLRNWQEFKILLRNHSSQKTDDAIVESARQTFALLHRWFVRSERTVQ